jgi:hypothetical protein
MEWVALFIAIVALITAVLAYQRTGGAKELKQKVESLSSSMESLKGRAGVGFKEQIDHLTSVTESVRNRTAGAIDRLEKAVRGKPGEKPPEKKPPGPRRPRAKKG